MGQENSGEARRVGRLTVAEHRGYRPHPMPRSSPKKDAVLSVGLDRSTAEIVSALAARGVEVTTAYVDILKAKSRSGSRPTAAKATAAKAPAAKPTARKKTSTPAKATPAAVDSPAMRAFRSAFVAVVLERGVDRAEAVFAGVAAKIRAAGGLGTTRRRRSSVTSTAERRRCRARGDEQRRGRHQTHA